MTLANGLRITRWRDRLFLARDGGFRVEQWSSREMNQRLIRLLLRGD